MLVLLLGGIGVFFVANISGGGAPHASEFSSVEIPLGQLPTGENLDFLGASSLTINGPLKVNNAFVLTPQAQPVQAVAGQLYFDQSTAALAYYNGTSFVTLQGNNIVSISSGSSNVTVTNDGSGNVVISSTSGGGSGTLTSAGGTTGRLAKFTAAQNLEDSLLAESGATITVNGDLSVTGATTLATPLSVSNGGIGTTTLALNGVIVGNGTAALTSVTAGGAGLCLLSTAGAPSFQACPGGVANAFVQDGNSFGVPAILGTNDNFGMSFEVNGGVVATLFNTGAANFINNTDTTLGFNVENSGGNNVLTVDTVNSRVGINLGGNNVPVLSNSGLHLNGSLSMTGTDITTYTTPGGATIDVNFGIQQQTPAASDQVMALGVGTEVEGTAATARVLSVFDQRAAAHQPSIAVFSPDENQVGGFSWDGSNTALLVKNTASGSIGLNVATTTRLSATTTGVDVTGLLSVSTLGAADTTTILCRNAANQIATCSGGGTAFVQGGNTFGATANLGTNDAFNLNVRTNGNTVATFSATTGGVLFQPTSDANDTYNFKTSLGNNILTLDTVNGRVGVQLEGTNVPTIANKGLEVHGALRLTGASSSDVWDTFTTPDGTPALSAKLSVVTYDTPQFGQIMALGMGASSNVQSRAISVFDNRDNVHQPSIAVFNDEESELAGFSWDGSPTGFLVKNSSSTGTIGLNINGTTTFAATTTGATVTGNLVPEAAGTRDLGSSTLEWDELYLADNNGIKFGLDQDATLAYDEATDDRVELTGTGASLFIEDKLGLGVQTFTITDDGVANDTLTPTASYVRVDQDETGDGGAAPDLAFSETGAKDGDFVIIVNNELDASNDSFTITDSTGVVNVNGSPKTIGPEDGIMFIYMNDRWVSIGFSDN